MRTITKTIDLYTVKELSDSAVKTAHERYLQNSDHFEFEAEFEIEHLTELATKLGIEIDQLSYTGFWSQGDGASFTGTVRYRADWLEQIAEFDCDICAKTYATFKFIGEKLQAAYDKCGEFDGTVTRISHHYYHENTVDVSVEFDDDERYDLDAVEGIRSALREYMRFCYRSLEQAYKYYSSLDSFKELADINEWEFDEDGYLQ